MGAGEHVGDETLVARDVYDPGSLAVGQIQIGKPQVDRDAAFLLLFQAVGFLAGQRLNERSLAVIDVAGCTDDVRHAELFPLETVHSGKKGMRRESRFSPKTSDHTCP